MPQKIRIRRGLKTNLPTLSVGELGYCTDTKQLYVGSSGGNVEITDAANIGAAPTNHASTANTYGWGDTSKKGHVAVTNSNGLSISNGVISMALATVNTNGAFSSADKQKLDALSQGNFTQKYTIINETQPSGTSGGSFASGAWRTRTLNTKVIDEIGVTLTNNQFALPAGKYYIVATAPSYGTHAHKIRIQNITDSTTLALGSNAYANTTYNGYTHSIAIGVLTIASSKTFEIQHICTTTHSNGFGQSGSFSGVNEVYAQVTILKVG